MRHRGPEARPRLSSYPQDIQSSEGQPKPAAHQQKSQPSNKGDSDSSDSEDPYLPFRLDMDSLDISKMDLEQLEQMDPRQAQLWMLLKMHQMVKKVEDVYESTEQLYSIYDVRPNLPPRPPRRLSEGGQEDKPRASYENTTVKRPVPKPRKRKVRSEGDDEATPKEDSTATSQEKVAPNQEAAASSQEDTAPRHQGNKSPEVKHRGAAKQYRSREVISKLHNGQDNTTGQQICKI